MHALWKKIFKLWQKYEHHLGVGAMLVGFAFDVALAKRPDSLVDNVLLLIYLVAAGTLIVILNRREMLRKEKTSAEPLFLLLALQFCFGGLASNLLVLYGHSGTLAGSAIFLGMLGALVLGNEYLRNRYTRLRFNIAVYYFLMLTYCVIAVPTFLFHTVGTLIFILSGLVSLLFMAAFTVVLWKTVLFRTGRGLPDTIVIVATIFALFNGLYFLDIIPPVPLSVKNIGVYHSVLKQSSGDYLATYEPAPWWAPWQDTSGTYTLTPGESAFCFSSVFAPTGLSTAVYHRWEEYDSQSGQWQTMSRVAFNISGGRQEGYRGWTMKANLAPGQWRCNVETASGALIGRVSFSVVTASSSPTLSQTNL
jgi:hypothetical protein